MQQSPGQHYQQTVLIVDDDPTILELTAGFLGDEYNVLTAANGAQAVQKAKEYKDEIHLLLSDFEMPKMSGIELATHLAADRPKLKVLLMSGFPGGTLVLNEGWHFMAKAFVPSQMRTLIRGLISPEAQTKFQAGKP